MKILDNTDGSRILLVLERGEKLVQTLQAFATEYLHARGRKVGYTISGLGALEKVELGYYELSKKDYIRKTFDREDYELISLTGNLALREGVPAVHVHAALGDSEFRVFGGHLFEAEVSATTEVSLIPLEINPVREMNHDIGLFLLCNKA